MIQIGFWKRAILVGEQYVMHKLSAGDILCVIPSKVLHSNQYNVENVVALWHGVH